MRFKTLLFSAFYLFPAFLVAQQGLATSGTDTVPAHNSGRSYAEWEQQNRAMWFPEGKAPIRGYKQFERINMYNQLHLDRDGNMVNPGAANYHGVIQMKNMMTADAGSPWTFLGPTGTPEDLGGIGRVNCVTIHSATTWFAGSAGGGLWKTESGGLWIPGVYDQPWVNLTEDLPVLSVSGVVVNPQDENEIYILTGDPFNYGVPSMGIFKTTDGGENWEVTEVAYDRSQTVYGYKLIANPDNYLEMYAATSDGLLHTSDGWITHDNPVNHRTFDVEFNPSDATVVYATTDDHFYKKCCDDPYFNPIVVDGSFSTGRRAEIAVTPGAPDWIYAVSIDNDRSLNGIYLSVDQGDTWTLQMNGNYNLSASNDPEDPDDKGQGEYCMAFYAEESNPFSLFYGCVDLYKSIASGLEGTWSKQAIATDFHADLHGIQRNPYSESLIACSDGGVYVSTDNGFSWENRNHGLCITQFYHIGVDNNWVATIEAGAGAQDNGTFKCSTVAGYPNDEDINGGDGFEVYLNSNYAILPERYTESQNGKLYYTGFTGLLYGQTTIYPSEEGDGIENKTHKFDTPYAVDPGNFSQLVIGYHDLYYSSDRGQNWGKAWDGSEYQPGSTKRVKKIDFESANVAAMITERDPDCSYCFNDLWFTKWLTPEVINSLNYWEFFSAEDCGLQEHTSISDVNVRTWSIPPYDAIDYYTIALSCSGYDSLLKVVVIPDIENHPDSVINMTYNLPNVPVLCIEQDDQGLYVGTDIGVFFLQNGTYSWVSYNNNLPVIPVSEIEIKDDMLFGKRLYISTYGRGMWSNVPADNSVVRRYVDIDATGTNDGTSWANAFVTLDHALQVANPGDSLWIAEGKYVPGSVERTYSMTIDGELLFGGFDGTETSLSQRNPALHVSRISGDIGVANSATDNSYHVLVFKLVERHCLLDGLTVSDGNANGSAVVDKSGGGCVIDTQYPNHLKRPYFKNVTFENNKCTTNGGALLINDFANLGPAVYLDSCRFNGNTAQFGGAIMVDNTYTWDNGGPQDDIGSGQISLVDCTFNQNTAINNGGAIYNWGAVGGHIEYTIDHCTFTGNVAGPASTSGMGGAIYNNAGSSNATYYPRGYCHLTYTDCSFLNNSADYGGSVADISSANGSDRGDALGTFVNCQFENGSVTYYGGEIFNQASNTTCTGIYTLTGCTFLNDFAGSQGGSIKMDGSGLGHCEIELGNCTFTSCDAGASGGAIYCEGFSAGYCSITADSCSFDGNAADNGGALLLRSTTSGGGTLLSTFNYCNFTNNFANGASNNSYGGAVNYVGTGTNIGTYDHCVFSGNHSNQRAGAMMIENNNISFSNCQFVSNYCTAEGGAIYSEHISPIQHTTSFVDCDFQSNSGTQGGAILGIGGGGGLILSLTNTQFGGNHGTSNGGGISVSSGLVDLDMGNCSFYTNYCTASGDGGAVSVNANGTIDATNCTFNANSTQDNSGALNFITVNNGTLTVNLNDCSFENNSAHTTAALLLQNNGFSNITANVQDCYFNNNHGTLGIGGIYVNTFDVCNVTIGNCTFLDNSSSSSTSSCGALYLRSSSTTDTSFIHVTDCIFQGNNAAGAAGALHIVSDGSLRSLIEGCRFKDNSTGFQGGAIRTYTYVNDYNKFDIRNCLFEDNVAASRGGAVFMETSTGNAETYGTIDQCVFHSNQGTEGGAVQAYMITTGSTSTLDVRNSTFYDNHATTKCGGLNGYRTNGTLTVQSNNNIFWGNTDADTEVNEKQLYKSGTMTLTSRNCDVQDGLNASITDGGGNINADPLFVNVLNSFGADVIWPSTDDGFSLQSGSPCINSANASYVFLPSDVAGTPRPQSGGYDIGAYEALAPPETPCPGDLNEDNVVNTSDLLLFMSQFGISCSGCSADLNNDGAVNTGDLLLFMSAYGTICPN